jgi:protease-4
VASDVIWRELTISRSSTRPIVVSMSDLAASGGYYISLAGDVIRGAAGTLTGSIGVYTASSSPAGPWRSGREHRSHQQRPARRNLFTGSALHPEEREKVQASMQACTTSSSNALAESRHMTPRENRRDRARRVWTGTAGESDRPGRSAGRLYKAIDIAKQRARIPADEEVNLDVYPRRRSMWELLSDELQSPVGGCSR